MPDAQTASCYHCGEQCLDVQIDYDDRAFCCEGCKTVYEILNSNGLCQYYEIDENAGISLKGKREAGFAYLDDPEVVEQLVDYTDAKQTKVTFHLPQIHCASCIWLLENLYKLNDGVQASSVNFLKKEIHINFDNELTNLRSVVELLASIGYEPAINLSSLDGENRPVINRSFFYKLGVAGFAFGNIMLLSFPEYLGLDHLTNPFFFQLFGYLNILLALPVVFYSGQDYLRSAWQGLRQRMLNIDVPISLGILSLFGRSLFEILTQTGAGYLDSLAGLVFFLLIGRWFQQRTYHNLSFERDYKSYFPIAARLKTPDGEQSVSLNKLNPGDNIIIKHQELIPADSILLKGTAQIDYSFVTGESEPVEKKVGDKIYAGGRQMGAPVELTVSRKVSQSYLTQLWNDEAFTKKVESKTSQLADQVGKVFTVIILIIAFSTLAYWIPRDLSIAINAFTAVLIIACPCAVALAIPFIFGNVVRLLGRHQFYLKNTSVIESLKNVQAVVFDKTGTITNRLQGEAIFKGAPLSQKETHMIRALVHPSSHPISLQIFQALSGRGNGQELMDLQQWQEEIGKGVQGTFNQTRIKLGSKAFMDTPLQAECQQDEGVYLQIGNELRGYFLIQNNLRSGVAQVLDFFKQRASLFLLSGDNNREAPLLSPLFGKEGKLLFRQSPQDKLNFVKQLQKDQQKVLMLGDGLNDAGALKQSDVGIVITEDTNNFTPACDAILLGEQFQRLPIFVRFARLSIRLVFMAYGFAFIYNVIGLSFAVQGALSPIVAAILMPLSSISIVLFGMLSSNWLARRLGL